MRSLRPARRTLARISEPSMRGADLRVLVSVREAAARVDVGCTIKADVVRAHAQRGEAYDENAVVVCFGEQGRPAPPLWVYAILNIEHAAYTLHTLADTYGRMACTRRYTP